MFATSFSFLEINIGFEARVALLFGLLEQRVGKISLLHAVEDVLDPALNIAEAGKKKERNVRRNTLTSTPHRINIATSL